MIFFLLDFVMSYVSFCPTYFILLNMVMLAKEDVAKIILLGLILDLLIFNTYFLNTLILVIIFLIYKNLKIIKINIFNYLLSLSLVYFMYVIILGLANHYSLIYIFNFGLKNYGFNLIFYALCYKIIQKHIKLSR